jgi:hypothetical protein
MDHHQEEDLVVENSPCHVVWVENTQIPSNPQAVELVMVENRVAICSAELSIIIYFQPCPVLIPSTPQHHVKTITIVWVTAFLYIWRTLCNLEILE